MVHEVSTKNPLFHILHLALLDDLLENCKLSGNVVCAEEGRILHDLPYDVLAELILDSARCLVLQFLGIYFHLLVFVRIYYLGFHIFSNFVMDQFVCRLVSNIILQDLFYPLVNLGLFGMLMESAEGIIYNAHEVDKQVLPLQLI